MRTFILALSLLAACTSQSSGKLTKYELMNSLWKKNATKDEVVKKLGTNFKETQAGIIYNSPYATTIESGHFFDASQVLNEQFIFLDEQSLSDLKSSIVCKWQEEEKLESIGHTVYSVKKGKCQKEHISFEFKPGANRYEVRWKK